MENTPLPTPVTPPILHYNDKVVTCGTVHDDGETKRYVVSLEDGTNVDVSEEDYKKIFE